MSSASHPAARHVLGSRVDVVTHAGVLARIAAAAGADGGWVCCANAHMLLHARDEPALRRALADALLVVPDGLPVKWALTMLGSPEAERVRGPELAWRVLAQAAEHGLPVAFYGGHPEDQPALLQRVRERCPGLAIAAAIAPPFRPLDAEETARDLAALAGARIILVGLGCPKQELWMQAHAARLPGAVLIGVGAFFAFASGRVREAPPWMQRAGLEWLHRLASEPRRLARRYLVGNPRFAWLLAGQLLRR